MLKQQAAHPYRHTDELGRDSKEAYYRLLGQRVKKQKFKKNVDWLILSMFANGAKMKDIADVLSAAGEQRCRMTVRITIRKYEMMWGLREYSPRELNKKDAS